VVFADGEKEWVVAKKGKFVSYEKGPNRRKVGTYIQGHPPRRQPKLGRRNKIFIEVEDPPKIAQVPVKIHAFLPGAGGDRRHHDVATIAGISRNRELEGWRRRILRNRETGEKQEDT
jgi:hypothetical protein